MNRYRVFVTLALEFLLFLSPSNGQQTNILPNGATYIGGLKGGPSGQGILIETNGARYAGGFKEGRFVGQGILISPEGTIEEGEWINDKPYRVSGTYVFVDGTMEIGTWNYDGNKSGGTIIWKDGRRYEGDWKIVEGGQKMPEGAGTMRWPDGRKYVGDFCDGQMEGRGTFTDAKGKVKDGLWKHDRFAGTGP